MFLGYKKIPDRRCKICKKIFHSEAYTAYCSEECRNKNKTNLYYFNTQQRKKEKEEAKKKKEQLKKEKIKLKDEQRRLKQEEKDKKVSNLPKVPYNIDEISTSTIGAIAELAISVDLMTKGYSVFRSLSPSCFCDLIATKGGTNTKYIEVRSGRRNIKGVLEFNKKYSAGVNEFAIYVHSDRSIYYIPVELINTKNSTV